MRPHLLLVPAVLIALILPAAPAASASLSDPVKVGRGSKVRSIPGSVLSNPSLAVHDGTIAVAYEFGIHEPTTTVVTSNASGSWTSRMLGPERPMDPVIRRWPSIAPAGRTSGRGTVVWFVRSS